MYIIPTGCQPSKVHVWIASDEVISFQVEIDLANERGLGGIFLGELVTHDFGYP